MLATIYSAREQLVVNNRLFGALSAHSGMISCLINSCE